MDKNWRERTELLITKEKSDLLTTKHVLIVGLGGVGGYAAEAIARAGIGKVTIVDGDTVDPTNRNRQIQALSTTHGLNKATLMQERMLAINPAIDIHAIDSFQDPGQLIELLSKPYDYVIDAIDSVSPKLFMLQTAKQYNQRIVSSMGAGGKMDPVLLDVVDISQTHTCPFAQYIRKRLRKIGINKGIKAVYSTELPAKYSVMHTDGTNYKKSAYGTISYLPAMFGLTCASVVIRDLIDWAPVTALDNWKRNKPKDESPTNE
jgi:tRNA threonylcarbamoyladenosine dehydratase